jgi:uroporphyrinogen-III decarboxylase
MGQVKGHPLVDLAVIDAFPWPDPDDPRRYANVPARLDAIDSDPNLRGKYRVCSIFMLLWERMQALHGLENCMLGMMEDNPAVHELADRLVAYDIGFIQKMHRLAGDRIDCFNFSEDWGTQLDLMVSPRLFRKFFLPRYQRIFTAVHQAGWHVWMHSCGKINKSISILIEAGVDVLNMQQPVTNGIDEIGRGFAGQVCFETLCDIQRTLPKADRTEIESQAVRLMHIWGTSQGGFILGDYGDENAIGTAPETKQYMLAAFQRFDPWKNGYW